MAYALEAAKLTVAATCKISYFRKVKLLCSQQSKYSFSDTLSLNFSTKFSTTQEDFSESDKAFCPPVL